MIALCAGLLLPAMIGGLALSSLRQNIPGYRTLGDPQPVPSRFSNYD